MTRKRVRWETMNKSRIPLSRLSEQYFTTCRTEGKTTSTLRGYGEKLGRFVRWREDATLDDFSIELAREYISYLQTVPKYQEDPYRKPNGSLMSATNVQNHVRALRAFSSWLHRERYAEGNILARLKLPKHPGR